jgi:hypothetical protein
VDKKSKEIARILDTWPYPSPTGSGTIRAMSPRRITDRRASGSRLMRAIDARRRLAMEGRGRAWINGREVGGADPRFAHLSRSYD